MVEEMRKGRSPSRSTTFGYIFLMLNHVKTVGIVLMIPVALIQLWDWTETVLQDDQLVANVEFWPFLQLPQLNSEFERFRELQGLENLEALIGLDEFMGDNDDPRAEALVRQVIRRVNLLLRERLPTSLPFEFQMYGVWRVRVTNDSRRSLSGVTITLPNTRYLSVDREGEDPIQRESGEVIRVGALRPQESVLLTSWASSAPPSQFRAERIELTHSEGIGEVAMRVPVGPVGQWIDRYWFPLLIIPFLSSAIFLNYLTLVRPRLAKRTPSQAAEAQPQAAALQEKTGEQLTKGE